MDVHAGCLSLLAHERYPERTGGAEATLRDPRRDDDEDDDRHRIRKRLEELGRDRHPPRLEDERKRLEGPEEVRPDEAQLRAPEGEDDEGDCDPARAARQTVDP